MKTVDELTELFRRQGLRVTPQRQAIFGLLHGDDRHPMGEVVLLDLGTGRHRVDPNVEHDHHHLICIRCGKVRDVPLDLPDVKLPPRFRRGFSVSAVEVNFRGLCDECAAQSTSTP
jgi:Fe2+ or Zn2+ uptake regulation protein